MKETLINNTLIRDLNESAISIIIGFNMQITKILPLNCD